MPNRGDACGLWLRQNAATLKIDPPALPVGSLGTELGAEEKKKRAVANCLTTAHTTHGTGGNLSHARTGPGTRLGLVRSCREGSMFLLELGVR
jgi:hypothetical protein